MRFYLIIKVNEGCTAVFTYLGGNEFNLLKNYFIC